MKYLDKVFVLIAAILVVIVFVFGPWEKSYVGVILDPIIEPDWEKIQEHHLIKSSTMLTVIEKNGNDCLVEGAKIWDIINHPYFLKANEFGKKINFKNTTNVITIPCQELQGDKSRLHVWFVTEEAPKDAGKYKYFITAVDETVEDK